MGKIGEHLFLRTVANRRRKSRPLDDAEKIMQQCRHFGIQRRFTFGKRAVQIIND